MKMSRLVCGACVALFAIHPLGAQTAGRVPFTMKIRTEYYKPDGTVASKRTSVYAVRRDGSNASADTAESQNTLSFRSIINIPEMTQLTVADALSAWAKSPLRQSELDRFDREAAGCLNDALTERTTLLGMEAVRVVMNSPPAKRPDGSTFYFGNDDWQAPRLNCYPLKRKSTAYVSTAPSAWTTYEVTEIKMGEPDSALFTVPSTYKEVSRAELQRQRQQEMTSRRGVSP